MTEAAALDDQVQAEVEDEEERLSSGEAEVIDRLTSSGAFRRIPLPSEVRPVESLASPPETRPATDASPQVSQDESFERAAPLPQNVTYILPPSPPREGEAIYMITVVLRASGDKTRDVLRMRRIYGIASTYPGDDRLAFQVFERGRGYQVEFPNFTTGWCPELISRLNFLIGTENVRVEPITFH
jgi:hypothetical protein